MSEQLEIFTPDAEPMEVGRFSYIRPRPGDQDFEEWLSYGSLMLRAKIRDGRELSEELWIEVRTYADEMHCAIFAMKAAEMSFASS